MCCRLSPDSPVALESARFVDVEGCMDHTRSAATNLQVGDGSSESKCVGVNMHNWGY